MVEPSTLIPNLNEIMEEHAQPEGEVHLEPTGEVHLETTEENRPSEQPEVQPVVKQQKRKGKERRQEEEKMSSSQKKLIPYGKSTMQERDL